MVSDNGSSNYDIRDGQGILQQSHYWVLFLGSMVSSENMMFVAKIYRGRQIR